MFGERARRARRAWVWACVLVTAAAIAAMSSPHARADARAIAAPAIAAEIAIAARAPLDEATRSAGAAGVALTRARPTDAEWVRADAFDADVLVYPPRSGAARAPVAVMLHGMCGAPASTCPWFASAVARDHWLVCPTGNARCPGAGATWQWRDNAALVAAAVAGVAKAHPGEVDPAPGMLIGFSWGALAAVDVAQRGAGRWSSLVLVAADVRPDAALLARAGVRRVYMGAGDGDMMKAPMLAASERLARGGVASTFVSLGNVGHTFPRDMETWVARAVAWTGDDDAF